MFGFENDRTCVVFDTLTALDLGKGNKTIQNCLWEPQDKEKGSGQLIVTYSLAPSDALFMFEGSR